MASESKRLLPRILLWTGLVAAIVIALAVAVVMALGLFGIPVQTGVTAIDLPIVIVQSLVAPEPPPPVIVEEAAPPPPPPPENEPMAPEPPPGERTHVVQEGETLWSIAKTSGLVNSPWEWRTIVAQNRDKVESAFLGVDGEWKVIMASGQTLTVRDTLPPASGAVEKKWAIQIMTTNPSNRGRAREIVNRLLAEDVFAFMYLSRESGRPVYRVRSGFYETEVEAKVAAAAIRERHSASGLFPEEFWVTIPSDRELRGEQFDFGAQRTKPWVIELPQRGTRDEAMDDLRHAEDLADFGYIAQMHGQGRSRFLYVARIGFFASNAEAQSTLDSHADQIPLLRAGRVFAPASFNEVLPGQRFKMGSGGT